MCKININNKYGSGFFLEIENYLDLNIPFKRALFTNNHVISEKLINDKVNIKLNYINNKKESISIYLKLEEIELFSLEYYNNKNESNLKRKIFTNEYLDYTCIEIFENDNNINDVSFFNNNINQLKEDQKDIFILQYPSNKELSYSLCQIKKVDNPLIYHTASTGGGSSGSPLIKRDDNKIIGIHFGGRLDKTNDAKNINFAINIDNILIDINNKANILIQ